MGFAHTIECTLFEPRGFMSSDLPNNWRNCAATRWGHLDTEKRSPLLALFTESPKNLCMNRILEYFIRIPKEGAFY